MKRIKVIIPIPMDQAGADNRASQLPPHLILPGFHPEFVPVARGASLADSAFDVLLMDFSVVEAGIRAEAEGYDAVCIDTVSDSGLAALRSRLNIPVIAPGMAAFHMACMLGKKFSVITMWDEWFPLYEKTLTEYQLWPRVASLRSINTRPDLKELLAGKEEVVFAKLEAEARKAMEEDGADVIVLGSTTMHQSHAYLSERLPIPVINPGQVSYKLCELLLSLDLRHSRKAYPAPQAPNDAAYHAFTGL
ncbi:aspartate/glutamate racemase family protein [Pseudomonas sp. 5P_3.1_Bac2]|uniref:aspartate/glutamate racemase family protein n=1 Tax=Pseudomonas sp. 5P_3.1_Bac2 TaxID=2971617 RepID=UPI0021C9FD7F|nr:aspartate/glutamate racemase family protein [Pseudomonas sp. 5P_3.1_Bac2]MCU1719061.1 aspartate/glutamate racemase family protein [Pseudomonas sp. 5P_3.1_Bac2]